MLQKQLGHEVVTFRKAKILAAVLVLVAVLGGCLPSQQLQYTGRVLDESTQTPIEGAEVTLTLQGGPAVGYSDAEGIYRFSVYAIPGQPAAGRVNVEASGYETFDQAVTISANSANFEEIHLTPLQALSSGATAEGAEEADPSDSDSLSGSSAVTSTLETTPTLTVEEEATATVAPSPTVAVTATEAATAAPASTATPRPTNTPAPTSTPTAESRPPFEGTFEGTITGDAASEAPLTLVLSQSGADVSGTATLGEGLMVNVGGGFCGGIQAVPATNIPVTGSTSPTALTHIESRSDIDVGGLSVGVDVFADLEEEGELLVVQIALRPPFFCLQPRLLASLRRVE